MAGSGSRSSPSSWPGLNKLISWRRGCYDPGDQVPVAVDGDDLIIGDPAIGPGHDRPGIVAAVARVLFEQRCNIENVSQTILKTEFAGSFIISMPPDLTQQELRQALDDSLSPMNMHIHIESILDQNDEGNKIGQSKS